MAAHRYWRIYVKNTTNAQIALGQIELRSSAGGADLTTPSTPVTASAAPSQGTLASLVNNSASSGFFRSPYFTSGGPDYWIAFDLGAPQEVTEIAITPYSGNYGMVKIAVQGSDDGTTWPVFSQDIPDISGWSYLVPKVFTVSVVYVGGNAVLDDGTAASKVLVALWNSPYTVLSTPTPDVHGDWTIGVPKNTLVMVTVIGPDGYQPICNGPITAVS